MNSLPLDSYKDVYKSVILIPKDLVVERCHAALDALSKLPPLSEPAHQEQLRDFQVTIRTNLVADFRRKAKQYHVSGLDKDELIKGRLDLSQKLRHLGPQRLNAFFVHVAALRFLKTLNLTNNGLDCIPDIFEELRDLKRLTVLDKEAKPLDKPLIYVTPSFRERKERGLKYRQWVGSEELSVLQTLPFREDLRKRIESLHEATNLRAYRYRVKVEDVENGVVGIFGTTQLVKDSSYFIAQRLFRLSFIQKLTLENTKLRDVPPGISNLTNLVYLSLTGNLLRNLPIELVSLHKLVNLDVSVNSLSNLPLGMEKMGSLQTLKVSGNKGLQISNRLKDKKGLEIVI